jgi:hypothetical protein
VMSAATATAMLTPDLSTGFMITPLGLPLF